jgi:hypothetical protein
MGEDPEKLEKMMKKRGYVIQEIISTEKTYVDRLRSTMAIIIQPLKEAKILDALDLKEQFEIFEHIAQVHGKHQCEDFDTSAAFVAFFDDIFENVQLYAEYLAAYEPAMQRRGYLLTGNRKFCNFLDKSEKGPGLMGQKLESILILPVQRIPRYRLLLEELRKCTPVGHGQYATVQLALEKISDMAAYSNEAVRARENRAQIMQIMLTIESRSRVDLLADTERRFVKEGKLLRQCRRGLKEFQFWLFNDQLLYGQATPIGLYILNRQIQLSKCHVSSEGELSFLVQSPAKSFIICARSEGEKQEWLESIQKAIVRQIQKDSIVKAIVRQIQKDSKSKAKELAPLWKPDAQVSGCKSCTVNFSLLLRRHHCRNCGFIVCDNCSKRRFKLEHVDKNKDVRVCDACFLFLGSEGTSRRMSLRNQRMLSKTADPTDCDPIDLCEMDLYNSDEEEGGVVNRNNIGEGDLEDSNAFMKDTMKDMSLAAQLHRQLSRLSTSSTGSRSNQPSVPSRLRAGSDEPKSEYKMDTKLAHQLDPKMVNYSNPLSRQASRRTEEGRDEFGMYACSKGNSPFASPIASPIGTPIGTPIGNPIGTPNSGRSSRSASPVPVSAPVSASASASASAHAAEAGTVGTVGTVGTGGTVGAVGTGGARGAGGARGDSGDSPY